MFMHFKFLLLSFDSNRSIARLSTKSGWPAWPTAPWPVVWGWIGEATCPVRPYPFGRPSPIVVESQSSTQEHRWRRYVCFPYFFFYKIWYFFAILATFVALFMKACIYGVFLPFGRPSSIVVCRVTIKHIADGSLYHYIFFTILITSANYWYRYKADFFSSYFYMFWHTNQSDIVMENERSNL